MLLDGELAGHLGHLGRHDDGVPVLLQLVVFIFWLIQSQVKAEAASPGAEHDPQGRLVRGNVFLLQQLPNLFVGLRCHFNHGLPSFGGAARPRPCPSPELIPQPVFYRSPGAPVKVDRRPTPPLPGTG